MDWNHLVLTIYKRWVQHSLYRFCTLRSNTSGIYTCSALWSSSWWCCSRGRSTWSRSHRPRWSCARKHVLGYLEIKFKVKLLDVRTTNFCLINLTKWSDRVIGMAVVRRLLQINEIVGCRDRVVVLSHLETALFSRFDAGGVIILLLEMVT